MYIKFFVILGSIYVINPLSIRVYHNIANTIHIIHNIYYLGSFTIKNSRVVIYNEL